jgi:peptide/nickel transport system substrate-binding protein
MSHCIGCPLCSGSLFLDLLVVLGLVGVASAQQLKPGGTLRVAGEANISGLDSYISPGIQSWHMVGNLFNSLITTDAQLNYIPELAELWDILKSGKAYLFHLCNGVKLHDGTDFDAEVVRWNYQRIMDPEEKIFLAPFSALSTPWKLSIPTRSSSPSNIPA